MRSLLVPLFVALLAACGGGGQDASGSEDDIHATDTGLGARCSVRSDCATGLVCDAPESGPPPGAVGMPIPPGTHTASAPPGAVGMPLPPSKVCQKPKRGQEGWACTGQSQCNAGFTCHIDDDNSGPPPGAVGMPLPPGSHTASAPPGAVGMPLLPSGECEASSGPPPGAVGMPLPPQH